MRLHLDTDLGGDIDDLQALAYLLASPEVELTGITTAAEDAGRRAGYVWRALELAGRRDVPVAAGIDVSSGKFRQVPTYPSDLEYWGEVIKPRPGPALEARTLLRRSLEAGATVVGIGPFTNLAATEQQWPGILAPAKLVLTGTTVLPPDEGLPPWGPPMDYNVQQDVAAASLILSSSSPLLVPLGVSMHAAFRKSHLVRLRSEGKLAHLMARQAAAFDAEWHNADRYRSASMVPSDMINFLYDPVACAIGAGWRDRVRIETLPVVWEIREDQLVQRIDRRGKPLPVVTGLDGLALEAEWVRRVSSATLESVVA